MIGWDVAFGYPDMVAKVMTGWRMHTKREMQREKEKMAAQIVENLDAVDKEKARKIAKKMAESFFKFSPAPKDYTLNRLKRKMFSYVENVSFLADNEEDVIAFAKLSHGDKAVSTHLTKEGKIPLVPVVFEKKNIVRGDGVQEVCTNKLYDLHDLASKQVVFPHCFVLVQRHVMLRWSEVRKEYEEFKLHQLTVSDVNAVAMGCFFNELAVVGFFDHQDMVDMVGQVFGAEHQRKSDLALMQVELPPPPSSPHSPPCCKRFRKILFAPPTVQRPTKRKKK